MAANPSIQLGTDGNWGIKEDNLLAYKKDGDRFFNKEFDFSRGSSATYVAKDGLIKTAGVTPTNLVQNGDFSQEGAELVTNGGFDTDSDWIKQSQWSIANGKATYDGTAFSHVKINQLINTTPNKFYKIKFTVLEETGSNFFFVNFGSVRLITAHLSVGNYEYYAKSDGSTEMLEFYANATDTYSIDNVSVVEVGQNWDITQGSVGDNKVSFSTTDGSFAAIQQNNVLTVGKRYKYSFEILSITGSVYFLNNNINYTTTGVKYGEFTSSYNFLQIKATVGINNTSAEITNISVQEIQLDTPRIDFTDSPKGALLLEPNSTNLIGDSEDASLWDQGTGTLDNVTTEVAPNGSSGSVWKFTPNSLNGSLNGANANSNNRTYPLEPNFTNSEVTNSIYLKSVSGNSFNAAVKVVNKNTDTEKASNTVTVTSDWQRFEVTGTVDGGNGGCRFVIKSEQPVYVWGYQMEQKSFATSYIPTYGTTATRLAETCTNSGSEQDFNSEEGVLYAEIARSEYSGYSLISINDSTNRNNVAIGFNTSNSNVYARLKTINSTVFENTTRTSNVGQYYKIAISYSSAEAKYYLNGTLIESVSNPTLFDNNLNSLDFEFGGGPSDFYGKVRNLRVFKRALSDTELYLLTSEEYQSYQAMATALNYTI